jgi:hypothetical protein
MFDDYHRDIWNEPDNSGYSVETISPLISQVFEWAREARPTQPLTTPLWKNIPWYSPNQLETIQIQNSDIISFHHYAPLPDLIEAIKSLEKYG